MTAPTDSSSSSSTDSSSSSGKAAKAPAVKVLDVVHFPHRDHLLGGVHDRFGVVVAVGDVLTVTPLERYHVQVEAADVTPLTPDDVS